MEDSIIKQYVPQLNELHRIESATKEIQTILLCDSGVDIALWTRSLADSSVKVNAVLDLSKNNRCGELLQLCKQSQSYRLIIPCSRLTSNCLNRRNPFYTIQELAYTLFKNRIFRSSFIILTDQVYECGDGVGHPVNSLVIPAAMTLSLECDPIQFKTIDYRADRFSCDNSYRQKIVDEVLADRYGTSLILAHDQKLYVPSYSELKQDAEQTSAVRIKPDGTYLITGGFGGFGLACAKYLVESKVKKLYISTRSYLTHDRQLPPDRQNLIHELQSQGTSVQAVNIDCSSEESVRSFFMSLIHKNEQIDGIIHAAGACGNHYLTECKGEDIDAALAPKVVGLNEMIQYTTRYPVEFIFLCSSLSSIIPRVGLSAYSAGNFYMDRMAHFYWGKTSCKIISVNFDTVVDDGVAVRQREFLLRRLGLSLRALNMQDTGIKLNIIPKILEMGLKQSYPQIIVCAGDLKKKILEGSQFTKRKFEEYILSQYHKHSKLL